MGAETLGTGPPEQQRPGIAVGRAVRDEVRPAPTTAGPRYDGDDPEPQRSGDGPGTRPSPRKPGRGVDVEYVDDVPVVQVSGRVDPPLVDHAADTIAGLLAVDVAELRVDLTDSYNGAELLPLLARVRADLVPRGGTLRLLGIALPEYLAALATAPLDQVFLIYEAVRTPCVQVRPSRRPDAPDRERP